jgi:cellulose synthase/poly-beta-1,6-N-acetylglucosamine synthase-like glycosyltransferase
MKVIFWASLAAIAYPYAIYPLLLVAVNRLRGHGDHRGDPGHQPSVTVLMPVHNEAARVGGKIRNLLQLAYPSGRLQIVAIADGCTDDSVQQLREAGGDAVSVIELPAWSGKAAALNAGLAVAQGEIIVFTDVGIQLEPDSLRSLLEHFSDTGIGCVSGEDHIAGSGSEGMYGRLELLLRREEARLHSIAGASGCFYAQRRELCRPFVAGMAPDFLSVLVTAEAGLRSIAEPRARGSMTSTASQKAEFTRKARTFLRGITALMGHAGLLNPVRYPRMSFILWSHKMLRWLAPVAMCLCLVASWRLRAMPFYALAFQLQLAAYALAALGLVWPGLAQRFAPLRIAAFFLAVNAAALKALWWWSMGKRIEVWEPTRRP